MCKYTVPNPYLCHMAYNMKVRDRIEAYPAKGTKKILKAKAKARGLTLVKLLNEVLEEAAK